MAESYGSAGEAAVQVEPRSSSTDERESRQRGAAEDFEEVKRLRRMEVVRAAGPNAVRQESQRRPQEVGGVAVGYRRLGEQSDGGDTGVIIEFIMKHGRGGAERQRGRSARESDQQGKG